jgi:hypothetical protein
MTAQKDFDFSAIRPLHGDRKYGFEELVCQLGRLDPPSEDARYFRGDGSGGDGGVEAYWTLADGGKVAYQAKYHLKSGDIDWGKVDGSVRTAMAVHPTIRRYVIAFPCNLTPITAREKKAGKGRPQKSGIEHWDEHVAQWAESYPGVVFDRWDESELIRRLTLPNPQIVGLRAWFFDLPHWTAEWFRARFEIAVRDLGERYHADENVAVGPTIALEGLARTERLRSVVFEMENQLRTGVALLSRREDMFHPESDPHAYHAFMIDLGRLTSFSGGYLDSVTDVFPIEYWQGVANSAIASVGQLASRIARRMEDAEPIIAIHFRIALHHFIESLLHPAILADQCRAVLFTGPPGIGKSHLLAEFADRSTRDGFPVLIIPAQKLKASAAPWPQLKDIWGVEQFSTEQILGSLNAAAQAANRRALILIDALNESGDAGHWRDHLGGFVAEILRYPCLAVAVSCRSDYMDWVIPEDLRQNFVTVKCQGFVSEEEKEQAARMFLDRKGIARPAVPWLLPDFTNPLFLRVTAEGLKAAGSKAYPEFVGLPDFIHLFMDGLAARHPFDKWTDKALLRVCLFGIARAMLEAGRSWLSRAQAVKAIRNALADHDGGDSGEWARRLLDDLKCGALLPMLDPQADRPSSSLQPLPEGVDFAFQRLGDLLMAEAIVDQVELASFQEGGNLAFVGRDPQAWAGLLGALAVLLPQCRGKELLDVATTLRQDRETAQRQFRDSLFWRPGNAFLPATKVWFDRLDDHYQLEVTIRLAVTPHHPWNADHLDGRLRILSMAERDVAWSIPLANAEYEAEDAVEQVFSWALGDQCLPATDETMRLTATILAWMLSTSARKIRDRATKALARVFLLRPGVMAGILDHFHDVNDPYVVERLWASAYGAAMNGLSDSDLKRLADRTWALCFEGGQPPLSLLTRDHALGIMELAESRGVLPTQVVMDRCRPPFATSWPLEEVDAGLIESQRNRDGAWKVASSVSGGDFDRYELEGALACWSATPLSDPPPRTGQVVFDEFLGRFVTAGSDEIKAAWECYEAAQQAHGLLRAQRRVRALLTVEDQEENREASEALTTFFALLPAEEAFDAERIIARRGLQIDTYDKRRAQSWLVKRVLDLGWTAQRFNTFDSHAGGGSRERPKIERIGKKYQWIALDELLARLSDNVYHISRWPVQVTPYRSSVDQPFVRDCDPSIIPPSAEPEKETWWGAEEVKLAVIPSNDIPTWVRSDQDVRCSSDLFQCQDTEQRSWLIFYGHFSRADGDIGERRRDSWSRVTSVMVRKAERQSVLDTLEGHHISDPSDHLPPDFADDGFYGEFSWRHSWPEAASGRDNERFGLLEGLPVIFPVIQYQWEQHLDLSMAGMSSHLPSRWLCGQMGLSPKAGYPGVFVNGDGETVFQDPTVFSDHHGVALIDRSTLLKFIESGEWDCLWLVGGEKNWWPGGMGNASGDHWACRYHSGVFWWENGEWQCRTWSDFDSRGI